MLRLTFLIILFNLILDYPPPVRADSFDLQRWATATTQSFQTIIDTEYLIPVALKEPIDTEIPGRADLTTIEIEGNDRSILIPFFSSIICEYESVKNVDRIPHKCRRIITQDGRDYRIDATVYGQDKVRHTPATYTKDNGYLHTPARTPLFVKINKIKAIGFIGGSYVEMK